MTLEGNTAVRIKGQAFLYADVACQLVRAHQAA